MNFYIHHKIISPSQFIVSYHRVIHVNWQRVILLFLAFDTIVRPLFLNHLTSRQYLEAVGACSSHQRVHRPILTPNTDEKWWIRLHAWTIAKQTWVVGCWCNRYCWFWSHYFGHHPLRLFLLYSFVFYIDMEKTWCFCKRSLHYLSFRDPILLFILF